MSLVPVSMNRVLCGVNRWPLAAKVGAAALSAFFLRRFLATLRRGREEKRLRAAIEGRRSEREESGRRLHHRLLTLRQTEGEDWERVWASTLPQLLHELTSGSLRPVVVLHAYQWKALEATASTNCVTQFFEEAEGLAIAIEDEYKDKQKPALFGLPISIKENVQVSGHDSCIGFASRLNRPADRDAVIVGIMREEGAVPFCATNLPQGTNAFSCSNPVYGVTSHPMDEARTPGGSSGGEGALVGMGGSPLGIASDILGSTRIPAHFCGLFGFKATSQRMSGKGVAFAMGGVQAVHKAVGPISASPEALLLFHRLVWSRRGSVVDGATCPLPFDEEVFGSEEKLRIGYFESLPGFTPTPAITRALREAKATLEEAGHRLVEWTPPNMREGWRLTLQAINPDGYRGIHNARQDIVEPDHVGMHQEGFFRWLNRCVLPPMWHIEAAVLPASAIRVRRVHEELAVWRSAALESWVGTGLDAVLCPPALCPALPSTITPVLVASFPFTGLFNALDCPAGVIPWTRVSAEDEAGMGSVGAMVPWPWADKLLREANERGTVGLPVGVQIVALPFRDEIALRLINQLATKKPSSSD